MSYESLTGPFIPQTVGNGHAHTAFSSASSSPPYARFPSSGRQHEEELINAFEAEEERILNTLSRKLEQVCILASVPLVLELSPFPPVLDSNLCQILLILLLSCSYDRTKSISRGYMKRRASRM